MSSTSSDSATVMVEGRTSQGALWLLFKACLYLGVLACAARAAPSINSAWILLLVVALSVPSTIALWHRATVRTLLSQSQFQPGRGLHWLASRQVLAKIIGALIALTLCASAVVHASLFKIQEWLCLGAVPFLYVATRWALEGWTSKQFRNSAFRSRALLLGTGWVVLVLILGGWVLVTAHTQQPSTKGLPERVAATQETWKSSPSAIGRISADAFAWGEAMGESAHAISQHAAWPIIVAIVFAPVATVAFLTLSLNGLALPMPEIRRVLSQGPSADDEPQAVTPITVSIYSAMLVLALLVLVQIVAQLEFRAKRIESPAAVTKLPDCEAIDGKVYKLGTGVALQALLFQVNSQALPQARKVCIGIADALRIAEGPVDRYLDWYFSLTAEWLRIWKMLTGDLEKMLEEKLRHTLETDKDLAAALALLDQAAAGTASALNRLQPQVDAILKDNKLLFDERSCNVVRRVSVLAALEERQAQALRWRTASSAGGGLVAGAIASKVAAKAITKTSMKAATKVLAKFAAKKAASVAVSTGAGAVVGSIVPGLGTVIGGAVGTVFGLLTSVSVDLAVLAAEESLTRDSIKADLIAEVAATLQPLREAAACN